MPGEATSTRQPGRELRMNHVNNLTMYERRNWPRIVQDIEETLRQCPSLLPAIAVRRFEDGREQRLVVLRGTVPIFYRGVQYNIPMDFWLPAAYPAEPPVLYVVPTRHMQIVPMHPHVGSTGRVYLPGLVTWNASESRLHFIVAEVSSNFSRRPPVYSIHPRNTHATQQSRPAGTGEAATPGHAPTAATDAATGATQHPGRTVLRQRILERARRRFRDEFRRIAELQQALEQEVAAAAQLHDDQGAMRSTTPPEDMAIIQEHARVSQELQAVREEVEAQEEWIDAHRELESDPDLETILASTDAHTNMVTEARASELAIQDTLQLLEDALRRGQIDIDNFLRLVRELAYRRFFICRHLRTLDGNT
ncbi:similar to vacuolar sorting protein/ubiquitin receptor VPS23 [Cyanidioschyzon merolae strain 10D]|jgi:ubiquitin-protein ligase|uniref:Similar to vacuolar sorting protein/ubiquitin receptor VPS23 n=1 Tax=Cyanidioschyzon merolae (strain NIES-3377 / 10D) TaxID=280699 RepID=M1V8C4_CYAM1|nr:similar to vacuolar sorting protein/ubiquitin receptor VPS23 [Cyanidioschyzon merolae strain 10D]BAM80514.1 similar to vacuolar sorting protein/ubiquitin receptor VPS23 [Cyanidioschyzon merolae strain 10D]|eukprot:XP_005536550.1 similar to vacuolar sorting protein/ubiquitin receptor VPS23 [Cyanidioschyzon merolae strain 10D]